MLPGVDGYQLLSDVLSSQLRPCCALGNGVIGKRLIRDFVILTMGRTR
jgi:hypothetical protein